MNFHQFVHEVTDIILTLDKNKIYVNSTLHVGRSTCEYFDDKNEEFEMDMWSYDWDLEKDFNKMKIKFNWKTFEKDYPHHYIHSYKNDNGSKCIKFATKMDLLSEEYDHDLKMIKEMIEYLNTEDLTNYE